MKTRTKRNNIPKTRQNITHHKQLGKVYNDNFTQQTKGYGQKHQFTYIYIVIYYKPSTKKQTALIYKTINT